jgi:peptidyl-prolyl cis-trans isomerase C
MACVFPISRYNSNALVGTNVQFPTTTPGRYLMSNMKRCSVLTIVSVVVLAILAISCSSQQTSTPLPPSLDTATPAATAAATWTPAPQQTVPPVTDTPTAEPDEATPAVAAAALVNGEPILLEDYEAQVSQAIAALGQQHSFDPNTEEGKAALLQVRHQILDSLIDQALIEQAAVREGITISDEKVEEELARLVGDDVTRFEEWLKANNLTRDSFKEQLGQQLLSAAVQEHVIGALPTAVEQVHARHILLSSEAEAMDVLLRLRSGSGFSALAEQYSQDQASKETGGDLGFFPRAVMPAEIEAVAFGLAPGQVSGIVKTDFGYHIVEIIEKDPAREVPEEMLPAWRQNNFLLWLDAHRRAAKIRYLMPIE